MSSGAIERVLACRNLPSLPGVALRVIELTRDSNVLIDEIAKLVQNDPALTAKILRTVNSSYYGLSNPCPTISRAVSLLGLNTVKSLVLGFSLVEMTGGTERAGFDLTSYWRRTIYSAAGARLLAKRTGRYDPEEAFIGALLQDVGMLAAHAALGEEYARVLAAAPGDHDELGRAEFAALGFDHTSVGSSLMERWRLPAQVVECTRRHHQPEHAAPGTAALVRLVALGTDAASSMTLPEPKGRIARLRARAEDWFGIPREELDGLLQEIADGAAQLSTLLQTQTGSRPDVAALLAEANEQLTLHQIEVEHEATALQRSNRELARQVTTDALTGAANRKSFDEEVALRFSQAAASSTPISLLFTDADRFKSVNDAHGHQAGDMVLVELSRRLRETVGERGTVCRYGGEEFAIILPGRGAREAAEIGERLRSAMESRPVDVSALRLPVPAIKVTISVGVASTEQGCYESATALVRAADEAVYAAKRAGRNCVRSAGGELPRTGRPGVPGSAPAAGPLSVLLVEDDPLAAKLVELLFARRPDIRLRVAASAEEALSVLAAGGGRPDALVCDLSLPGMSGVDLIARLRQSPAWRAIPILAISAQPPGAASAAALAAGASMFATKALLCSDFGQWVQTVADLASANRRAA